MTRSVRRWIPLGWQFLLLTALLGSAARVQAQVEKAPAAPPADTLLYRLIYAPLQRIAELAEGEYRTMKRQDFFAQVQALQQRLPANVGAEVFLRRADYAARLEGQTLVEGQARLDIESLSEALTVLPLESTNLALDRAAWIAPTAASANLGSSPHGQLVLLVPRSGTLQWAWSRQATPSRPDELVFDLQLPPCPANRLELTVPAEYTLTCSQGLVQIVPPMPAAGATPQAGTPMQTWRIDLGGNHELQVQLRRSGSQAPAAWLQQVTNYAISEQGLELSAELHLDCPQEPLTQLALQLDPPLRLTKARCGEQALTWTSSRDELSSTSSVLLTFPQPLQGRNRIVYLAALAPLPESAVWALPRIQPQQVLWQQESAWLKLSPPLRVSRLDLDQARRFQPSDATAAMEPAIALQYLTAAAQVQLELDRPAADYQVTSGTTVRRSGDEALAEVRAEVRTAAGDLFDLTAEVAAGWNVEAVEAEDRELIHDWQIRSSPTAPRQLEVRFTRPLDPDNPARLRIQSRRQLAAGSESIPLSQLCPLAFVAAGPGTRHFLVVLPAAEQIPTFAHDERVTWLRLDDLDPTEVPLIAAQTSEPIVLLDDEFATATVTWTTPPTNELPLTASLETRARLTADTLHEQYRLTLDRSAAGVGSLRVRLTPEREPEIRWFLEQNPQRALSARRLSGPQDDLPDELWEIDWPDPSDTPWVIVGERTSQYDRSAQISLLSLPGAKSQDGTVWIEAPAQLRLEVRHSPLLMPVPSGQDEFRRAGPPRRAFSFAPRSEIFEPEQGLIVNVSPRPAAQDSLCVWRATIEAQLDPAGTHRFQAILQLENQTATEFRLRLPASSRMRRVLLNGSQAKSTPLESGQMAVPLPENDRFPLLQVMYEVPDRPVRWSRTLDLASPEYDAPVLDQQYLIWTAPGYELHERPAAVADRWQDRLRNIFGPLLRPSSEPRFDPLARDDWRRLLRGAGRRPAIEPRLQQLIEQLGRSDVATWRDFAQSAATQDPPASTRSSLWVDEARLAARGITPSSPLPDKQVGQAPPDTKALPDTPSDTPPDRQSLSYEFQRGLRRLQEARLVLLQSDDAVVLMSAELLGLWASNVQLLASDCVGVLPGERLLSTDSRGSTACWLDLVPASSWSDQSSTWHDAPPDLAPYAAVGWQLQMAARPEAPRVQLGRRDLWLVAACVAFVTSLALASWLSGPQPLLVWCLLVAWTALALLVPAPWSVLLPGVWWGTLFGLLRRWLPRRPLVPAADEPTVLTPHDSRRVPIATLWIVGLLLPAAAQAQVDQAPPDIRIDRQSGGQSLPYDSGRQSQPYEIFVPTADGEQPLGDYLFVPRGLQVQLLKDVERRQGRLADWLLQSAEYRVALSRSVPPRTVLESLTAEYEIYVPELNPPVHLPLAAAAAGVLEREGRLDGRPFVLQWLAESAALVLPVQQAGLHRLQLTFRPTAQTEDGISVLDLPVPPVPRARLILSTPDKTESVQIVAARGTVQPLESSGQLQAELGPTDRLVIRWGVPSRTATPAVEQSSWLRLLPEQVRLDVRIVVDTRRRPAQSILIEADERLQLEATGRAQPLSLGPAREDGMRLLQFAVQPDEADQAHLELSFVVSGWSGLGRLRLPRCRVLDQPDVSHWLAVSADPRLIVSNESTRESEPRLATEFAQRWGGNALPDLAFRLLDPLTAWTCSTTFRDSTTLAEIQTAYEISRSRTRLVCAANLNTQGGSRFQQRLEIPAGYKLESVTLVRQGESRPARWAANSDGKITVIYDEPLTGSYQLLLRGQQLTAELGQRRLSRVRLLDCNSSAQQLFVYRGRDVMLSPLTNEPAATSHPQLSATIAGQFERSRKHAVVNLTDAQRDPLVDVSENKPQLKADLINVVTRQQGVWYHQLEVRLQVEQGILDGLWFEIPETWVSSLPRGENVRVLYGGQSPHRGFARVIIWPAEPWRPAAPIWFSVDRIPVPVSPGEPLTVPNVRLLEQGQVQRFLYLPTEVESQAVLWSTTGLEVDPQGPDPAPEIAKQAEYRCFRIRDEFFQATRLPGRTVAGKPRVHLADIHLVRDAANRYHGLALLDLEPGGAAQCQLRFPQGIEPLRIDVEDSPVTLSTGTDPSVVPLELMSDELPQRIGVLFAGRMAGGSSDTEWVPAVPRLHTAPGANGPQGAEIEVAQTLWTVAAADGLRPVAAADSVPATSAAQQELLRLRHLSTMFGLAQQMSTEFSRAALARWYSHWGERFQATLRRAERAARQQPSAPSTIQRDLVTQQQAHRDAATKLDVVEAYEQWLRRADPTDQLTVWQQSGDSNLTTGRWQTSAGDLSLPLRLSAQPAVASPPTWFVAALVAIVGWVGAGLVRQRRLEDPRWRPVAGLCGGIAWWLWLQPSALGLLLAAVSVVLLVRRQWQMSAGHV